MGELEPPKLLLLTPFECVCTTDYYDTTHGEIHCFNADNRFASSE
eukprot:SAG11_NODE_2334_length_3504_cov_30.537151_4_plen_44_part_01